MIETTTGNLLTADVDALVNTVNCVGVMGKGIALQFKQAFPAMFKEYSALAKAGEIRPGMMHVYETGNIVGPRLIINFPTKRHWKARSRMEDVQAGLDALVETIAQFGIRSIAIPPLGCGNGGLNWADVKPLIEEAAGRMEAGVRVVLFEPAGEPVGAARVASPEPPRLTPAKSVLIALINQYRLIDFSLTLVEVQKLAYFLQVAGEDLRLNFKAAQYGPYAHNLNHVLRALEGHYLEGAISSAPDTEVKLRPGSAEAAAATIAQDARASERLNRVSRLIEGFETPYSMELLATVHWTMKYSPEAVADGKECVRRVHEWGARKRRIMKAEHIEIARQRLLEESWTREASA
jgi:O-acetyl-ADP-ribose deacetylase (regulator of RNase III)